VSRRRLLVIAGLGLLAALAVGRLVDVEEAIREVTLPLRHDDIIRQQAAEKHLDPALIAAVIYAESRFRDEQQSHAGARGLMQVTPETARAIAEQSGGTEFVVSDLDSAQINISYGSYHLRDLLDTYDDNLVAALAAYNAGSGNVDEWGGAALELEDIRFPETRAYVEQVLAKSEEYRDGYAEDLGI
jgi:soluble lytic murein transglycosylase